MTREVDMLMDVPRCGLPSDILRLMRPILLTIVLTFVPTIVRAEARIAYVDLQRAVDQSNEGKQVKSKLQAEYDRRQHELDAQKEDLKRLMAEEPKKQELLERQIALQQRGDRLQREIDEKLQTETNRIFKKMKTAITQVAEAEKVAWVLDSSSVLYAPAGPGIDLTDEVVKKFNATK
jgi:outer membrane protein